MDSGKGTKGRDSMPTTKSSGSFSIAERLGNKGVLLLLGGAFFIGVSVFLIAMTIPKERRACALMPGFCAPKKEAKHSSGKFEGMAPPAGAAPFSLNQ